MDVRVTRQLCGFVDRLLDSEAMSEVCRSFGIAQDRLHGVRQWHITDDTAPYNASILNKIPGK
jgi:hypothetical protein